MLLEFKNITKQSSKNLIFLHQTENKEKIYVLKRKINPINVKQIKDNIRNNLKSYLYDNEFAYIAIATDNRIEIYRDLFGLSDIYYCTKDGKLNFSESLRDFYAFGINNSAIEQYKRLGYIPAPNTIINGVKKMYPGEKIKFDDINNNLTSIKNQCQKFLILH